ncbi:MAG: XRE family transcriptional regulator [Spirochaetes bacterium]|nr:XRE family transcriptional regulator [Spirochaetota bacterium]
MEDIRVIVGANLKAIRKARQLTLESLSSLTEVSISMLGEIERGSTNPTIAVLWKIANGLQIAFTELIKVDRPPVLLRRRTEGGPAIEGEGYRIFPLFDFDPEKRFEIFYKTFAAGSGYESAGHREGIEEYIFVGSGELTLGIGDDEYRLDRGDAIRFHGSIRHRYRNDGTGSSGVFMIMFYGEVDS